MAKKRPTHVPAVEWVTGIVALVIVVSTVGFITWESFGGDRGEPDLHVSVEATSMTSGRQVVTLLVRNAARQAAAEVMVEGVGRGSAVRRQTRLDYVAGLSTRRATLVFPESAPLDPQTLAILSFTVP